MEYRYGYELAMSVIETTGPVTGTQTAPTAVSQRSLSTLDRAWRQETGNRSNGQKSKTKLTAGQIKAKILLGKSAVSGRVTETRSG